ncbi:MAG: type II toxin-antitoxin system RelE/ParE family toxin [Candidatus Marinimicrobia bacterium]|nr:type II toxin-antitoxin system RelE/ParE family toxin [Candidatus Neomarinimicrobiota bacterium]MCH8068685.1 type II toxin-antitoxin system RelE/ParE family toxin [Candidatus Neomarinimicrobiota bacterium]
MYKIQIKKSAQKSLLKIPRKTREILAEKIYRLGVDEKGLDIVKINKEKNLYRLRHGDYRVIYEKLKKELIILVIRIKHRKEVYR